MTLTEQQQKGQEILNTIIKKSWEDESFKQELINDPKKSIISLNIEGISVPEDKKVVVEDQTGKNIIYLNIPVRPELDELELTDEELELASGGETFALAALFVAGFTAGVALYAAVK